MQLAVMLRVGVTFGQIENEHLQNFLVFRVWIIWGAQKIGGHCPRMPPVAPGLHSLHCISAHLQHTMPWASWET